MESREYVEEIDLQKYLLVLNRRWIPAVGVFGIIVSLALLAAFIQKPKYESTASILIKPDRGSSIVGLDVESADDLKALTNQTSPLITQAEIIASTPIAEETIGLLSLKDSQGEPLKVENFLERLQVKGVTRADVLEVTYEGETPEQAAEVVSTVVDLYIKNNISSNRAESSSARDFINSQLPQVESAVQRAEIALRQFKERNKIVALDDEAEAAVDVIAKLDEQLIQARAKLAQSASRSESLRNQLGVAPGEALKFTSLSQSSGVQEVLGEYQELQSQLASERTRYRDGHPAIDNLERRADALQALLQQRVGEVLGESKSLPAGQLQIGSTREQLTENLIDAEVERLSLVSQVSSLATTQAAYRARASVLPQLQQQQAELERKLQASQSTYETLLNRLQEIQVAENQNIGNARIISPALIPENPSSPNKKLYLAAGLVVGILLAIFTAFALELLDQSVKTLKEARDLLKYPLLGVIPAFSSGSKSMRKLNSDKTGIKVLVRDLPATAFANAYQMLQANLKFLTSDIPLKVIVVTSSVPQEGKSTVSANLAAAIAQTGRRVLLVDADMRHPSQHHIWDLTNLSGLSNVIVGQTEAETVIQPAMQNLDVLLSGVVPPNPIALLDSRRMAGLTEQFSNIYDFIIFDTPPLSGTADAAILGKMTDGVLLVARPGVVDTASAMAAREFLEQSGQHVLGLVANGVLIKNEPDSYFYYSRDNNRSTELASPDTAFAQFSTGKNYSSDS